MVDRYTKIILTIIAANLTITILHSLDVIPQANASAIIQKVAICDFDEPQKCARIIGSKLRAG